MPTGTPRRRTVWQVLSVASAALLGICLIAWAVSLFRSDLVYLRLKGGSGIGFVNAGHRTAFGWSRDITLLSSQPTARIRWESLGATSFGRQWFEAHSTPAEASVVMPWAVPAAALALCLVIATRKCRRPPKAFEVLPVASASTVIQNDVDTPTAATVEQP